MEKDPNANFLCENIEYLQTTKPTPIRQIP